MATARKVRSDILVGNLEKKLGLEPGAIRNPDGSDARSNKKLVTLQKEYSKAKGTKIKTNPTISSKLLAKASKAVSALSSNEPKAVKAVKPIAAEKKTIKKSNATTKSSSIKTVNKIKSSATPKKKTTKTKVKSTAIKK